MSEVENTYKEGKFTIIQLTITLILIILFSVTGATYAFFAAPASDDETITGTMATVNLTLAYYFVFVKRSFEVFLKKRLAIMYGFCYDKDNKIGK